MAGRPDRFSTSILHRSIRAVGPSPKKRLFGCFWQLAVTFAGHTGHTGHKYHRAPVDLVKWTQWKYFHHRPIGEDPHPGGVSLSPRQANRKVPKNPFNPKLSTDLNHLLITLMNIYVFETFSQANISNIMLLFYDKIRSRARFGLICCKKQTTVFFCILASRDLRF